LAISFFGSGDAKEVFKKKGEPASAGHPEDFLYVWVTAKATKEMVESGEENELDLFKKKEEKKAEKE
jgi:hypothetical protein